MVDAGILLLAAPDAASVAKGLVRIVVEEAGAEEAGIWFGEPGHPWRLVASYPDSHGLPSELTEGHEWRLGTPAASSQVIRIGNLGLLVFKSAKSVGGVILRFVEGACRGLIERWVREKPDAERDRRTSVLRLEAIIRRMTASLLVEDEHRRIALVNQQFCDLFGIPVSPEQLIGADCSQAADQSKHLFADPVVFVERIGQILAARQPVLSETVEMVDGRYLERDYIPLFIEETYSGHLWLYRDTTSVRLETERTDGLRRFYEQVLEAMPAQLAVFDKHLRYQYLTPSAVSDPEIRSRMLGLTDSEYCLMRGIDPAVGEKRMELVARVRDTQQATTFEESFKTPTGGFRHFVRYVSPVIADGEVTHILGYGLDISEMRSAADRLRRNEAISRAVTHASFDAVITADSRGTIVEFSRAAEKMFEISSEDAIGRPLAEVVVPEALRDRHIAGMARFNRTGEARVLGQLLELPARRADGTTFDAEVFIEAIAVPGGEQLFTAFIRDVSERKEFERDLVAAREAAESAKRATERFLATMSHEMRTPLNAVLGLTHLLMDSTLDHQQHEYLSAIRFSADHLRLVINDVLDVAKIQSGHLRVDHLPFRLRRQLQDVIGATGVRAAEKMLSLELDVADDVPDTLAGDPVRVSQILVNLIGNAVKFTSTGGVRIAVARSDRGGDAQRAVVRFEVQDTGIGIAEDEQELVFGPFAQSADRRAREAGGTGLGLHIVRELTGLLGGSVALESRLGRGSTFVVELPFEMVGESAMGVIRDPLSAGTPLTGRHILLVEDNEMNQVVASGMLRRWGAVVTIADNGLRALERIRSDRFDLVLMDIQMPIMNGFEATRRIRADFGEAGASIPIIALTASVLLDHRSELVAAGLDDFVLKPFDPSHLLDRITTWLPPLPSAGEAGDSNSAFDRDMAAAPPDRGLSDPGRDNESRMRGTIVDRELLERNTLGRADFSRRLVDLFREHTPPGLEAMRQAAFRGDLESIRAQAHSLKSSAGMLGIVAMQDRLDRLEQAAREGDAATCGPAEVEAISKMYLDALVELESTVSGKGPKNP